VVTGDENILQPACRTKPVLPIKHWLSLPRVCIVENGLFFSLRRLFKRSSPRYAHEKGIAQAKEVVSILQWSDRNKSMFRMAHSRQISRILHLPIATVQEKTLAQQHLSTFQ
jgi:hypothetical protein